MEKMLKHIESYSLVEVALLFSFFANAKGAVEEEELLSYGRGKDPFQSVSKSVFHFLIFVRPYFHAIFYI